MPTLRLTQSTTGQNNRQRVEVALEGDGLPPQIATAEFDFLFTPQDREDLRWYLEDYLQYAADPAPKIAARIEGRIAEIGNRLWAAIFESSKTASRLWARLQPELSNTRIEIVASVREATSIPWELLRDPLTETALALEASAFVRGQTDATRPPKLPRGDPRPIRILLVICRPGGADDVPFRSVASRLIKGLGESARESFELDLLRPPTFAQLGRVLRRAKDEGKPYHVVHFDGHGTYAETNQPGALISILGGLKTLLFSAPRAGTHGYLLFENPSVDQNVALVDGPALGSLLVETDVRVLVLNACRSAHAEAAAEPQNAAPDQAGPASDVHSQVRAFGSLAQEVVDAGVVGVVAMRYNVYVVTAAQFVADLYGALAEGLALGEAVTRGRKQLHDAPWREIAYEPRPLQDWLVPIVYEAASIAFFPKRAQTPGTLHIAFKASETAPAHGNLDSKLPAHPDVGFFGRDETLLALDRAFDTQPIVLLHAYAGSGKTAAAAEFARWYALTGGIEGPVLFTSFEQYRPLERVLDQVGERFGGALEQADVHWLSLSDAQRREIALHVMRQVPVLWIWDNVEPVAGFPDGTASAWIEAEREKLANFLRDARQTKAKFLLTSRRDERGWLGDLPARVPVPPMPMQERVQLARALAEKHGRRLTEVEDWQPLLRFTHGNPLTLIVVVGQALRDGLKTKAQIETFVFRLRSGESAFEDEASEGRSKSLGASLSYGFERAFSEAEHKQLALLHFFQGIVQVQALRLMGDPDVDWCVPEVRGLTREAWIVLLDRAAEVGLLMAYGVGYYGIHPALPWFFKTSFDAYYPLEQDPQASFTVSQRSIARAFAEAMSDLGNLYWRDYEAGNRDVIEALIAEEGNFLHARRLARIHGWWKALLGTMQGLSVFYIHTGRRAQWVRLVDEIVPEFVDPITDGPLPGREESHWSLVTQYRVWLAREARQWTEAERLQNLRVQNDRRHAASALTEPSETTDREQRHVIESLSISLHELGQIQRELGKTECVILYQESLTLARRIGDRAGAAVCAFNLGHAYKDLPALRDLAQAERWYQQSLELHDERDRLGRGRCLFQLGATEGLRFDEARMARRSKEELDRHLSAALDFCNGALAVLPQNLADDLAQIHAFIGRIYGDVGDFDRGRSHYEQAIRLFEETNNFYLAGATRINFAFNLEGAGRFADAREYACAALRDFETVGAGAAKMIRNTKSLIAEIEGKLQAQES